MSHSDSANSKGRSIRLGHSDDFNIRPCLILSHGFECFTVYSVVNRCRILPLSALKLGRKLTSSTLAWIQRVAACACLKKPSRSYLQLLCIRFINLENKKIAVFYKKLSNWILWLVLLMLFLNFGHLLIK